MPVTNLELWNTLLRGQVPKIHTSRKSWCVSDSYTGYKKEWHKEEAPDCGLVCGKVRKIMNTEKQRSNQKNLRFYAP